MRWDFRQRLRFASLQGETARELLTPQVRELNTLIYWRDGVILQRSDAVLQALQDLGGWWKVAVIPRLLPRFFRDAIYLLVARNRYVWFGQRELCRVPSESEKDRLLP